MTVGAEGYSSCSGNGMVLSDEDGGRVSVGGDSDVNVAGVGNLLLHEAKMGGVADVVEGERLEEGATVAVSSGVWSISIAFININSLLHKQLEVVELAKKNGWDFTFLVDTRMREHHVFCDVGSWKWLSSPLLASGSTEAGGIAVLVSPRIANSVSVVPVVDSFCWQTGRKSVFGGPQRQR